MEIEPYLFSNFTDQVNVIHDPDNDTLDREIGEIVSTLVLPFLPAIPGNEAFLDIGCGDGRFGVEISKKVSRYIGVDIRTSSLDAANTRCRDLNNCEFHLGNGRDLNLIEDNSIDRLFSYHTFVHMPDKTIVINYLREICRVLKQDGIAKIQLAGFGLKKWHMDWIPLAALRRKVPGLSSVLDIIRVLPEQIYIPVFRLKDASNHWGRYGGFISVSDIRKVMSAEGAHCWLKPCTYDGITSTTRGLFWLYISKTDRQPKELSLG